MALQIGVFCIVLISFVTKIESIVLEAPRYSRYDPCCLGTVHFDMISNVNSTRWMAVLNQYTQLDEIDLEIQFRDLVGISAEIVVHQDTHIAIDYNNSTLVALKHRGQLPKNNVIFYVNVQSGSDVPFVTELKLNDQILCSDSIRASQAKQFDESYSGEQVCGLRSIDHAELVTTNAKRGEWPWHVAILLVLKDKTPYYSYSGTIISKTAVLTAGSCVRYNNIKMEPTSLMVLAGKDDVKDHTSDGAQLLYAEEVILHPSYSSTSATADLAIIKVSGLRFTEYVQPICLWRQSFDKSPLFGKQAMSVGFHNIEKDSLRSINLWIQSDETCIKQYTSTVINEFTFCADFGKDGETNSKWISGGGGLVTAVLHPDNGISWYLTGVFTFCTKSGKLSCDYKFPTVYTMVAAYASWIQHHSQGVKTGDSFDKLVDTTEMAEINKLQ